MRHTSKLITTLSAMALCASVATAAPLGGLSIDSSSGFTNSSYLAPKLIDGQGTIINGNANMGWMRKNPVGNPGDTSWVIFDLGSGGQTFNKIRTYTRTSSDQAGYNLREGTVEVSDDKINWTTLNTVTAPELISRDASETAFGSGITARYVRLTRTDSSNGGVGGRVGEVEFYNHNNSLAVWERGQNDDTSTAWLVNNNTFNLVDDNLTNDAYFRKGTDQANSLIIDTGSSQDIEGFRALFTSNTAGYSAWATGDVYVTDDPTNYGTKVMDWDFGKDLADGEWGEVNFVSPVTGRYIVVNDVDDFSGGSVLTSMSEFEIVIPEPASLMLLGLGGAVMLVRRRKA